MPASTPGPMTDTSRSAQISELIERDDTMPSSAAGRISVALGVVFRAARNATGTAGTSAASVPSVAMLSVSHSGRQSRAVYAQRGGDMRGGRSAPWAGPPPEEAPHGGGGDPLPGGDAAPRPPEPAKPAEEPAPARAALPVPD